jgi:hypothetical protein
MLSASKTTPSGLVLGVEIWSHGSSFNVMNWMSFLTFPCQSLHPLNQIFLKLIRYGVQRPRLWSKDNHLTRDEWPSLIVPQNPSGPIQENAP